jgi:hypothetical protein
MSNSTARRSSALFAMTAVLCAAITARGNDPRPLRQATIQAETRARLTLQSQISSKLSEVDDTVTATLTEPIYVEGAVVLPRGTEFHGRITNIAPAKRGERSSQMSITFEHVVTPSGEVPILAQVTAIDDWDKEETIKADHKGNLKGGHRGEKTIENIGKGSSLGWSGALIGALLGGAAGASGRQALGIGGAGLAAGMIGGLLLTKGREIRVGQGSILRIRFLQPATLAIVQHPGPFQGSDE